MLKRKSEDEINAITAEISMLLRDKDTFEQSENIVPFYKNIKREGVALYG